MAASATGRSSIVRGGTGTAYLYDALADTFTVSNRIYTQNTIQGYFGPLAAAPDGSYYLANGLVLNSSLAAIGGSELASSPSPAPFSPDPYLAAGARIRTKTILRPATHPTH